MKAEETFTSATCARQCGKGFAISAAAFQPVLEALADWREATARERDLPKGFVLRDNTLLDLSRAAVRGRVDLQKLGLHPRAIRRDGDALLALIEQARTAVWDREGIRLEPEVHIVGRTA